MPTFHPGTGFAACDGPMKPCLGLSELNLPRKLDTTLPWSCGAVYVDVVWCESVGSEAV